MEGKKQTVLIMKYLKSLKPHEMAAYEIAKKQLESSFDISKSIGFMEFKKEMENK
jgi:hypothetical protein